MQVIIFKNDDGGVQIIYPVAHYVEKFGIDAIAKKDVPNGKPYKIVDINDLPLDGTFNEQGIPNIDKALRGSWTVDEADLTDGVGADYGAGSNWEVINMMPLVVRHIETGETKEVTE